MMDSYDAKWYEDIEGVPQPKLTATIDFLDMCLRSGQTKGYIRYNATSQQLLTPNIITMAAVLDAVPLEDGHPSIGNATMVFDALSEWAGYDSLAATTFVYENYVNVTTSMAKMNPGLDVHGPHKLHPPLTHSPHIELTDYVVKERLFAFFLNFGCIPFTKEHALVEKMVKNNPWPRPITVYGYDDTFAYAGDLFEAETTCVKEHNLGQVASQVNNFAFFSRKPRISQPVLQPTVDTTSASFNKSKTYVTFIIGDGDNVDFMKGSRRNWMQDRVARCASDKSKKGCFPLSWTISPHLLYLAPDWVRWYYNQSYTTTHDYFVLPPSGHTYSYPGIMQPKDQEAFVKLTEEDARLLNTSGSVDWEFFGTWQHAINKFFPRYSERGIVRGLFGVNVPYMIPVAEFGTHQQFKVLGKNNNVVAFRPNEWRGTKDCSKQNAAAAAICRENFKNATEMSLHINDDLKLGTVAAFYTTSDGGMNMGLIYDTVKLLGEHVEVVNQEVLVAMALASESQSRSQADVVV
jgi:hypothetical protein